MKYKINRFMLVATRQSFIYAAILTLIAALLIYQLGTLVTGFSQPELSARAAARSGQALLDNPLFLPHKLMQYVLIKLGQNGAFWMRLPSVIIASMVLVAFYRVLRTWYSVRIAMIGSFLFLSSSWFLHFARLGTPEILYAGVIALLWVGIRLKGNEPRLSTVTSGMLIVVCALYVPGMVWVLLPVLLWQRKVILHEMGGLSQTYVALLYFGLLIGLVPLVYSFVKDPLLVRTWLAIPANIDASSVLYNLWHVPVWLILNGPVDAVRWLGRVPLIDVFSAVMFILGSFVYVHHILLDRVRTIIGVLLLGVALTALNGPWMLVMILPIVYMVVVSGLALLLQQWFTVFPRNPLARGVGVFMVGMIVVMAAYYHISHYFIAWPNAKPTQGAFRYKG